MVCTVTISGQYTYYIYFLLPKDDRNTKTISITFSFWVKDIVIYHFCNLQNKILNFIPAIIQNVPCRWNSTYNLSRNEKFVFMNIARANKLRLPIHLMNTKPHAYEHLKKLTLINLTIYLIKKINSTMNIQLWLRNYCTIWCNTIKLKLDADGSFF
jgi:hypothetical protein